MGCLALLWAVQRYCHPSATAARAMLSLADRTVQAVTQMYCRLIREQGEEVAPESL